MAKDLIIPAPNKGISSSPHVGNGDCRNLDINTIPGIARLNNLLAKKSGSTVTDLVLWLVRDPITPANVFALDLGGQVYKSDDSGATWATVAGETAGGVGQGMTIFKDYLIVARATNLDTYGPLSGGAAWNNSWQTIDSDTAWHPMIVSSNDNKLYGGAGRYVFSLDEVTGQTFAPGTAATFTYTQQALDLPPNYKVKTLAELSNNLMIGTWQGTNIADFKIADIFPWDRSSPSFGLPLQLSENGVNSMININNTLFIQAGIDGKIFSSNGSQANVIAQIPSSVSSLEGGKYIEVLPGAMENYKGRLFFGLSTGGSGSIPGMGVWSMLQTSQGNILNLEHIVSTGNDGTSNPLKIGALLSISRDTILAGWRDNATYGIDLTTNTLRTTSYGGYFESAFYTVGSYLRKRQFSKGQLILAQALASGEGIRLKYRTDLSSSFTTIGTYDFSGLGAVIAHSFAVNIPYTESAQIRCELTTGASNTSPQIKSIILN